MSSFGFNDDDDVIEIKNTPVPSTDDANQTPTVTLQSTMGKKRIRFEMDDEDVVGNNNNDAEDDDDTNADYGFDNEDDNDDDDFGMPSDKSNNNNKGGSGGCGSGGSGVSGCVAVAVWQWLCGRVARTPCGALFSRPPSDRPP